MEIVLGPFSFSSNFECGNLVKVLPIHLAGSATTSKSSKNSSQGRISDTQVDYEFNLWTRPDCGGTEFENNNRTWFFFCIKGGVSGERVQLSVMNLNKQSKLYSQGMQPVVRCIGDCVQSSNWERIKEKCSYRSEDSSTVVSWVHTVPPESRVTYYAFTYPYTFSQLQTFLRELDDRFSLDASDLYYYRELLTYSLDGSQVDLITITSHLGKQEEREDRISGIFPDLNRPRPSRFSDKKVVFVSARVHPGETPSSFVMSGFINFIISSDARAKRLRDRFVFKIIPMLNPDGVIRGHYRTDQRGVNLNRVYCDPSPEFHPTIYAAKKVILYYHYGMHVDKLVEMENQALAISSQSTSMDSSLQKSAPPLLDEDTCHSFSDAVIKSEPSSGIPRATSKSYPILDTEEPSASGWDCSSNMSADSSCRGGSLQHNWDDFPEDSSQKFFASGETGVTSMFDSMSPLQDFKMISSQPFKTPPKNINFTGHLPVNPSHLSLYMSNPKQRSNPEEHKSFDMGKSSYIFHSHQRKDGNSSSSLTTHSLTSGEKVGSILSPPFSLRSSLNDSTSKLFMYMDFHGHASKRGIFMYGNWFEDPVLMVENMLYPKLLSLHCSNFDFGACNFSERNMYHRDRRDGMSKEGSGRVSVMRATGLVRSYTLECNYNTGRLVSPIPSHGTQRPLSFHGLPLKYTPATFEDCGHKLGICLHDLVEADEASKSNASSTINLNVLRNELLNLLSSSSASPRTSNLSSCSLPGSTPSPKTTAAKSLKDFKSASEDIKCKDRGSVAKSKSTVVTMPKINLPVAAFSPKQPSVMHSYGSGRRQSLSSTVDAENLEPHPQRPRATKTKNMKGKKDGCGGDASQTKAKKFRHKSVSSKKVSSPQSMLYKDMGETSHFSSKEKLSSSKHSLSGAVCLPGDVAFKMSVTEKPDSAKLMKKIEKGRKQRTKTLKFGSKKLKNISSVETSSTSFKPDQFGQVSLQEKEDTIGSSLAIDPCCVSNPNPLSPRSPLASVFETQTSQGSQGASITLKQQSTTFVGVSKNPFHSCTKRQSKPMKPVPSSSDRFPIGSPASGQRLKLFPKKLKKKASNVGEVSAKSLSKPTTSQPPLQWVIRKPLKITSELETSSLLNPRVKKRKKSARKSI